MQPSSVKEHFPHVKQCIDNAAQLCQITKDIPDELRDSLSLLGRESDAARQLLEQEKDADNIRQCVDRLEKLGDRSMQACKQSGKIDWEVESAVREAHDAIAELKHGLH
jgi:glutamine amidotransferase PdxT